MKNFDFNKPFYLLCEGASEIAIINILLDNKMLKFDDLMLHHFEPLLDRGVKAFERDYLNKDEEKIQIIRVLDSKNTNNLEFKLSLAYRQKVKLINCVTAPEIEILMIIAHEKYQEFTNRYGSKIKASTYVKTILKIKKPKSTKTINKEFSNPELLRDAILKYAQYTPKSKKYSTLSDLLK